MQARRRRFITALATGGALIMVMLVFWTVNRAIRPGVLEPTELQHRIDPWCTGWPPPGFERPPQQSHSGEFVNARYGFAVRIPAADIAYTSPGAGGLGILLSWSPRAWLRVQPLYDVFYDINASNAHLRDVGNVRIHDRLLSERATPWRLDGVQGARYLMRLQCSGNPQVYVHDMVIAVHDREIYRVQLQTVPDRYDRDVRVLDALLRSWRWVPLSG